MTAVPHRQPWARPSVVTALYIALAIVMTWPLVTVMNRRIAADMGDPLLNCWILMWTGGQVLRALRGDLSALGQYWNGNIFHPNPLTLAYSEHLTPEMLQILPVFAITNNIILCYNLVLLATIVLSGLGMYLFVRDLTNQPLAAFLAGVAFAFAPFRIDQYGHIEVLTSQWMPLTLLGFRRFFVTSRVRPLAWGTVALVLNALSCGYYMAYFTPFAVVYCLYEMSVRGKLFDARTWRALIAAGTLALVIIGAFLYPYMRVRQLGDVGIRGLREIQQFSADTHAFGTIAENSKLWGSIVRARPAPENQGFPGFTILAFSLGAIGFGFARVLNDSRNTDDGSGHHQPAMTTTTKARRALVMILSGALVVMLLLLGRVLITGRVGITIAGVLIRHHPVPLLLRMAVVSALLMVVSRFLRKAVRRGGLSLTAFFGAMAIAAAWMSLGPTMFANGRNIGPGLYNLFYEYVPGFNGLRVPSLNFMLVALFLAVLTGLGSAAVLMRRPKAGRLLAVAGMMAILAESWTVPTESNANFGAPGYHAPPAEISGVPNLTPLYAFIHDLPTGTVVVEFPFGDLAYEIRHVFNAGYHRQPIVNGYSGFFPTNYALLVDPLSDIPPDTDAWAPLLAMGATHAIVHEGAFLDRDGAEVSNWLRQRGAREIAAFEGDRVFQLR